MSAIETSNIIFFPFFSSTDRVSFPKQNLLCQQVKNDFLKSGVSPKFKGILSDAQFFGCVVGTINDDHENPIYDIEFIKETKTNDYFIRGNIPADLNRTLLEKGINRRCNNDNLHPPESETTHHLECTISSVDQLKILVDETKKFYNPSPLDNDQTRIYPSK